MSKTTTAAKPKEKKATTPAATTPAAPAGNGKEWTLKITLADDAVLKFAIPEGEQFTVQKRIWIEGIRINTHREPETWEFISPLFIRKVEVIRN